MSSVFNGQLLGSGLVLAAPSAPDYALAWVLPNGDGTYHMQTRDGVFIAGFKSISDAIDAAKMAVPAIPRRVA